MRESNFSSASSRSLVGASPRDDLREVAGALRARMKNLRLGAPSHSRRRCARHVARACPFRSRCLFRNVAGFGVISRSRASKISSSVPSPRKPATRPCSLWMSEEEVCVFWGSYKSFNSCPHLSQGEDVLPNRTTSANRALM